MAKLFRMAGEDPRYLEAVRRLPCCGPGCTRNPAGVAHHMSGAGMALRAHDHNAMPLCPRCHHDFHALCGAFKGWVRPEIQRWQWRMIYRTRAAIGPRVDVDEYYDDVF